MTTINIHVTDGAVEKQAARTEPWNGTGIAGRLIKSEDERKYTLTMAYPANTPDAGVARDGHQDFATADEVEKAAWSYLANSPNIGLWHENGTDGAGRVVESYIYRGPDWVIKAANGSEQTVQAGDWLLGIQWDDEGWSAIKEGRGNGVSMQGRTNRRTPSPLDMAHLRKNPNA